MKQEWIQIAMASTLKDFKPYATLIASIARRTEMPVWVKFFSHGFSRRSFASESLRVDFIGQADGAGHLAGIDFAYLAGESCGWDRCIVMTSAYLALCDLAPWYTTPLHDHLLSARVTGRCPVDETRPEFNPPTFQPGFIVNLQGLRGLVEARGFAAATAASGGDSLETLRSLVGDRIHEVGEEWCRLSKTLGDGDCPEELVHWEGRSRPWDGYANIWGVKIWAGEKCSWEALQMNQWRKPEMIEVQPASLASAKALAERGWKVWIDSRGTQQESSPARKITAFPDLKSLPGDEEWPAGVRWVRFGSDTLEMDAVGDLTGAAGWLAESGCRPAYVTLCGPLGEGEISSLRELGYSRLAEVWRKDWPTGGPDPEILAFHASGGDAAESGTGTGERNERRAIDYCFVRDEGAVERVARGGAFPVTVERRSAAQGCGESGWLPVLSPLHGEWRQSMRDRHLAGAESASLNLVFSADKKAFTVYATTLHSIVRRSRYPVHVRCYCRGFAPESFFARNLLVEFLEISASQDQGGCYPWWSNSCAFDRLMILKDHPAHWDRCWIMDHDQIATADLAGVFFEDFEGKQVMACSYGYKMGAVLKPEHAMEDIGSYEFYMMGPILNLAAAREGGTWERLIEFHRRLGSDEQKSLVAATGGELKVMDKRWNRVVYYGDIDRDYRELFPTVKRPETDWYENYGILHFTGGPKPWWDPSVEDKPKKKERVWFKEYATWDKLRQGDWSLPEGCTPVKPA